jgi:hypothetical protein
VNDEPDSKKASAFEDREESKAVVAHQEPPPQSLPQQFQILVDLEKQRIESHNRRTDVARYAIEMNDAADKRQFEFRMAELQSNTSSSERRHHLAKNVALWLGIGSAAAIALLLIMAFFGTAPQSAMAIQIFIILGIGIGGYGAIESVKRAIAKLLTQRD